MRSIMYSDDNFIMSISEYFEYDMEKIKEFKSTDKELLEIYMNYSECYDYNMELKKCKTSEDLYKICTKYFETIYRNWYIKRDNKFIEISEENLKFGDSIYVKNFRNEYILYRILDYVYM